MFTVAEGGGEFKVSVGGLEVGKLSEGDMFGETALLMRRPRSATVECESEKCRVIEMSGSHFLELLQASPEAEASLRDLSRRREFKKGMMKVVGSGGADVSMRELFNAIDTDGDGALSAAEVSARPFSSLHSRAPRSNNATRSPAQVKKVFHRFDASFPEQEIQALLESMDLDGSGNITWREFERVVGLEVR